MSTVVAIALMVTGLAIIGSLPAPLRSPLDIVERWRGTRTDVHSAGRLLACAGAVVLTAVWVVAVKSGHHVVAWTASVVVATLAVSAALAAHGGRSLRRWRQNRQGGWDLERVTNSAATTAGWGVVYGTVIAVLAGVLFVIMPGATAGGGIVDQWMSAPWWSRGFLITTAVMAAILLLVTPWFVPWRARVAITRRLVDRATRTTYISAGTHRSACSRSWRSTACSTAS
ncbi:hypothetical protein ACFQV2_20515 [Actinokineospora soli]|uniref:Uncharacterized protein n=1 Tax=Actinokineospora soli TaxID=1048753 RepID=A0ABW2TRJ1_9PSEU